RGSNRSLLPLSVAWVHSFVRLIARPSRFRKNRFAIELPNLAASFPPMNPPTTQPHIRWNRRNFLKTATLATGAVVFGVPTLLRGQNLNSKLNIASIGAGGKGASDTDHCSSENIIALCDVDTEHCAGQL